MLITSVRCFAVSSRKSTRFLLAFGTQGALDGSTAYVVRSTTDAERPYCISVSNLVAGVIGIGLALVAGLIAEGPGVIVAIVFMGVINAAGAVYCLRLPDVTPGEGTGA